jgi:glucose/arabinose dehydrogenase
VSLCARAWRRRGALALAAALVQGACGEIATLPVSAGMGAEPVLPAPVHAVLPTVDVARATGWPAGAAPVAAPGMRVAAFARELDHPRWLLVLPDGGVLVAESNAPARPAGGLMAWLRGLVMARAGAAVPSAERITLLRDTDGDGVADVRTVFIEGLVSPFGMALIGNRLYVADTDAVLWFPWVPGAARITTPGTRVAALPAGPINHHWTKSLVASADGLHLYVGVGSNSNVGENGMAAESGRAAVWEVRLSDGAQRIYASGLRNPVGLAWAGSGGALWVAVNERDELGSDLVPDYMTALRDGAFYGWPWSYYGSHVDTRVTPPNPALVAKATVPDYALGPHTASLGLAWAGGNALPARFAEGMFVGQHGSWNRRPKSGYKVIFVPFAAGRPAGAAVDVLGGFLGPDDEARGRPVGIALDRTGALLVADDVGNVVWRVSAAPAGVALP